MLKAPEYELIEYKDLGDFAVAKLINSIDRDTLWRLRSVHGGEINMSNKRLNILLDFFDKNKDT